MKQSNQLPTTFIVFVIALGAIGAFRGYSDWHNELNKPVAKVDTGIFGMPGDTKIDLDNAPVWEPAKSTSNRKPASESEKPRFVSKNQNEDL